MICRYYGKEKATCARLWRAACLQQTLTLILVTASFRPSGLDLQ